MYEHSEIIKRTLIGRNKIGFLFPCFLVYNTFFFIKLELYSFLMINTTLWFLDENTLISDHNLVKSLKSTNERENALNTIYCKKKLESRLNVNWTELVHHGVDEATCVTLQNIKNFEFSLFIIISAIFNSKENLF